jgi:hypothetical protein
MSEIYDYMRDEVMRLDREVLRLRSELEASQMMNVILRLLIDTQMGQIGDPEEQE